MTSIKESIRRLLDSAEGMTREETEMTEEKDISTQTVAETSNYIVWSATEADGEETFHIELGLATIHFFKEEWEEFLELCKGIG